MKEVIKKVFKNLFHYVMVNIFLLGVHFLVLLCLVIGNNEGFDSIFDILHIVIMGIAPLVIASIIMIVDANKKKEYNVPGFIVFQSLLILFWFIVYVINLVPNSNISISFDKFVYRNIINKQEKINKDALDEFNDDYALFDSISDENKTINLYFNDENKKIIVELIVDDKKNYDIIDTIKKDVIIDTKYSKNNSNIYITFTKSNNMSICKDDECYYLDNESDDTIYDSRGRSYELISTYKYMIKESISNNELIYSPGSYYILNIQTTDTGIEVVEDDKHLIKNQAYKWVIYKNGKKINTVPFNGGVLNFEKDLKYDFYYATPGQYECYIEASVDGFYNELKLSNTISWSIKN